ncbi:MAG: hypothetical protein IK099_01230 [Clostridia bacterium]|nr:hypothetical protein [Clostridia bacterium]
MSHSLPEPFSTEDFTPGCYERQHEILLRRGLVQFTSISEDFVFRGPDGEPEAALFSISYLAHRPKNESRPVMFLWNGGPGSATSILHLECFGPWLIKRDGNGAMAFGLTENPDCLLDVCDLVFVDPVGVGLSRLLNPEKAKKYYCVDGDARSAAFLIIEWLRRRQRWNSPIYITGESYGTVRACRVIAELGRSPYSESRMVPGIPVKGAVLIGLAVEESRLDLSLSMMPAMAATHWYHMDEKPCGQAEFVQAACDFARTRLLVALYAGDGVSPEEKQRCAKLLEKYTGMPKAYFLRTGLRVLSAEDFQKQALPGYTLDLYDARMKTPADAAYRLLGSDNVPLQVMNGLLLPALGVDAARLYYTGNINVNVQFSMETEDVGEYRKTHLDCLRDGMERTPDMQALFASGLYDLCTHAGYTRYLISHAGLPKERVLAREYPGGHGVYSSPEGKEQFLADVRKMIEA